MLRREAKGRLQGPPRLALLAGEEQTVPLSDVLSSGFWGLVPVFRTAGNRTGIEPEIPIMQRLRARPGL
jgi:hypothetical protein